MHVKLGHVYKINNDFSKASHHYNSALSIQPDNKEARAGLDEIEQLISGNDDDEIDSEQEEEMDQFMDDDGEE